MAESNAILGGALKYRDGRKWKPRYCVLKKLSPVADRLHISLYKDLADYHRHHEEKQTIPLEKFYGIELGFSLDKENHVMAIVCQAAIVLLAADTREELVAWEVTIRAHLGVERQFPATLLKTPHQSHISPGPCKLFIQGQWLCFTTHPPPRILATWNVNDLRKFGVIDGHFCFEAGAPHTSGKHGVYAVQCSQSEEIEQILHDAAEGKVEKPKRNTSRKGTSTSLTTASSLNSVLSAVSSVGPTFFTSQGGYKDLDLVEEEEEVSGSCDHVRFRIEPRGDSGESSSSGDKQKLVSIDDVRRQHFCDIYNVPPRRLVKVQSLEEKHNNVWWNFSSLPRRYSCGDLDCLSLRPADEASFCDVADSVQLISGDHTANSAHNNKVSKRRIRRTSYPQPHGATETEVRSSTDTDNMSHFYTAVQQSLDVLSPKLRKCDPHGKGLPVTSSTSTPKQTGQSFVITSHGHSCGRAAAAAASRIDSTASGLELLQDIFQTYKNKASSNSSSCSSSHDLAENTPILSCSVAASLQHSSLCDNCHQLRTYSANSTKNLSAPCVCNCKGKENSVPCVTSVSASLTSQSDLGVDMPGRSSSRTSRKQGRAPALPGGADGGGIIDPHKPLQYVDLNRFDGVDQGDYLYWLKSEALPPPAPPQTKHANYQNIPLSGGRSPAKNSPQPMTNGTSQRTGSSPMHNYMNIGPTYSSSPKSAETPRKSLGKGDTKHSSKFLKGGLLSIHGSLKRHKKNNSHSLLEARPPPPSEVDLNGAYVRLRPDVPSLDRYSSPPVPRQKPRGRSLENVLEVDSEPSRMVSPRPSLPGGQGLDPGGVVYAELAHPSTSVARPPPMGSSASGLASTQTEFSVSNSSLHMANSNGHHTSEYMLMTDLGRSEVRAQPSDTNKEAESVFCAVELPRKNSTGGSQVNNLQDYGAAYSDYFKNSEKAAYMEMSGFGCRKLGRSMSVNPHSQSKPTLQHSRSLDNELDGDSSTYLDMNPSQAQRHDTATYMDMSLGSNSNLSRSHSGNGKTKLRTTQSSSALYQQVSNGQSPPLAIMRPTAPLKPFDNLVSHQHHSLRKPGRAASLHGSDRPGSEEDKPNSAGSNTSANGNSSKTNGTKTPGLLSRLIRRNSQSKEAKKSGKNTPNSSPPTARGPESVQLRGIGERTNSWEQLPEAPPVPNMTHSVAYLGRLNTDMSSKSDIYVQKSVITSMLAESDVMAGSQESLPQESAPRRPPPVPARPPHTLNPHASRPVTLTSSVTLQVGGTQPVSACSHQAIPTVSVSSPDTSTTPVLGKVQYVNTDPDASDIEWAKNQAPALPVKSYRSTKHAQSPTTHSAASATPQRQESVRSNISHLSDDVFYENQPRPNVELSTVVPSSGSLAQEVGDIPKRRGAPSLTVDIPHPAGSRTKVPVVDDAIPVIVDREEEVEFFPDVDGLPVKKGPSASSPSSQSTGRLSRHHRSTNQSEASLSSCGSTDTTTTQLPEDLKTSPALTTLRPRFGKEYQRVDRKKLAEELNTGAPLSAGVVTAQSPSVASTSFSFDAASLMSERKSFSSMGAWSSGEDSPKPSLCSRQSSFREHHYMNLSFPRNESHIIMEATPPGSPRPNSRLSSLGEAQLNYAEIDLSEMEDKSGRGQGRGRGRIRRETTPTEYAVIDMEATAAASRVGREHVQLRENSLMRKEWQMKNVGRVRGDQRPSSAGRAPSSTEKKAFLTRHSSLTSKDR